MLKTQLQSKIFQLDPNWAQLEDILTGDFFGILDYLPRYPYLHDFIEFMSSLNPDASTPPLDDVNWEETEIVFWPRMFSDEENAEPDIVIISDKWVLVIEVKLGSGFGGKQPWREYVVGCKIAQEHSIAIDSVYYLVLARKQLDIAPTFKDAEVKEYNKLRTVTSYLKWHEAVALIQSWLREFSTERPLCAEHKRMLTDLYNAMKKRRAIAFSGFAFENMLSVETITQDFFCPPRFTGFLTETPETKKMDGSLFISHSYGGFGMNFPDITQTSDNMFFTSSVVFLHSAPACHNYNNIFLKGFSNEYN